MLDTNWPPFLLALLGCAVVYFVQSSRRAAVLPPGRSLACIRRCPALTNSLTGPKGLPLIGNAHQLSLTDPFIQFANWTHRYGSSPPGSLPVIAFANLMRIVRQFDLSPHLWTRVRCHQRPQVSFGSVRATLLRLLYQASVREYLGYRMSLIECLILYRSWLVSSLERKRLLWCSPGIIRYRRTVDKLRGHGSTNGMSGNFRGPC
jgi:hypothetical protein